LGMIDSYFIALLTSTPVESRDPQVRRYRRDGKLV
jgi:hypothetical protein